MPLNDRRIVVLAGTGGVGKTTLSAAFALQQAMRGKRVLVLTIDPARRLAQAMGLKPSAGKVQRIGLPNPEHTLYASMLDARMTFDHVVERYAPNPDIARRILANRYYQQAAGALGGSQEYMAMEALLEAVEDPRWDLVVLDTPPSANALDFLEAPSRLLAVLERGSLSWLITPAFDAARAGTRLFGRGGAALFRVFERLTGAAVLQGISEFVTAFADLLPGFRDRASKARRLLTGSDSAFVLVTIPHPDMHQPVMTFAHTLEEHGHQLALVAINRCHPAVPAELGDSSQVTAALPTLNKRDAKRLHEQLSSLQAHQRARWAAQQEAIEELSAELAGVALWRLEESPSPPHDLQGLMELSRRFTILEEPQ